MQAINNNSQFTVHTPAPEERRLHKLPGSIIGLISQNLDTGEATQFICNVSKAMKSKESVPVAFRGRSDCIKMALRENECDVDLLPPYLKTSSVCASIKDIVLSGYSVSYGRMNDEKLKKIVDTFQNVERLDLSHCTTITSKGLKLLAKLQCLVELDVSEINIEEEALFAMTVLTNIQKLTLDNSKISEQGLKLLAKFTHLIDLDLGWSKIGDDAFETIVPALPKLKRLNLMFCESITAQKTKLLATLTDLVDLDLCWSKIDDEAFQAIIPNLTKLQKLSLDCCKNLTSQGMRHLTFLPNLVDLDVNATEITDETLRVIIPALSKLERLNLSNCVITGKDLVLLPSPEKLTELHLANTEITDEALLAIVLKLSNLQKLNLESCQYLTAQGIKQLEQLPNLVELALAAFSIDDEALEVILPVLSQVQRLKLYGGWNITAQGVQYLTSLSNLVELELWSNNNMNDEILEIIVLALPNLQRLHLKWCTNVTGEKIQSLKDAYPELEGVLII